MDPEARAWGLFCAAVFFWMGIGLFSGAAEHADSALAWMASEGRPAAEGFRRRLVFMYRLGGAFFAGFGVYASWASPLPAPGLGRGGRLLAGAFFLVCGCVVAAAKAVAGLRRGAEAARGARLGLETGPEPWRERARRFWGWGGPLILTAFGAYLLSHHLGGHHD